MPEWTTPKTAEDVSEEILSLAESIIDGWYSEGRIDWEDVFDRMDGRELDDGSKLDLPDQVGPAVDKIKRHIRAYRAS